MGGATRQPRDSRPVAAEGRDAVIDLVRFVCLALVVVGHCMMVSPVLHPDGTVTTQNTLAEQDWFVPVIWIFMVMPLFFVTGGITGLQSWRRLSQGGGTASQFVRARLLRLVRPATALLAVMFAGLAATALLGVHPQVVGLMAAGAGMPLWFLAAYLAAQLNIPFLAALHTRAPWLTSGALAALVVAVDCLRGALPGLAYANLVLSAVTGLGLYPGNMLVNLNPPNLCLLLLGITQAALLELARPVLVPVCSVRWVSRLMMVAGSRSLTVYLWHLPLLVGMSGLLLLTPFPKPASGTAEWWWGRPLVLLALILLLLAAVAAFGRLEERPTTFPGTRCRPARVGAAVVVVFLPVAAAALGGLTLGLLGAGAACFAAALMLLLWHCQRGEVVPVSNHDREHDVHRG